MTKVHRIKSRKGVETFTVFGVRKIFKSYKFLVVGTSKEDVVTVASAKREMLNKVSQIQQKMTQEGTEPHAPSMHRLCCKISCRYT